MPPGFWATLHQRILKDAGFTLGTYTHTTRQKQDEATQAMGILMAQTGKETYESKTAHRAGNSRPVRFITPVRAQQRGSRCGALSVVSIRYTGASHIT